MTGLNPETIRMYRERGLVRPCKNEKNGYYDYRIEDMFSLLYIRQMRSWEMSMKEISQLCQEKDLNSLLESFDQKIGAVKGEILRLETRLRSLELTRQHILECHQTAGEVVEMDSIDDKYDLYLQDWDVIRSWDRWKDLIEDGTIALRIGQEVLNADSLPEKISVQAGIGTYRMLIKDEFSMAKQVVCCPKGHCLSLVAELDNLSDMPKETIEPLWSYAKKHGYRFVSDTTAFLVRIDTTQDRQRFVFRIRVRVEPKLQE